MTNARVVTFDIANGTFDFYTQDMWESQVQSWRDELFESGMIEDRDIIDEMDYYEVVECIWGEEMFVDYIPEDVK
tara:strand:+ start:654 stop:878 length:225 start_codon:yes stop_codon:yes gene_type:complete